MEERLATSAGTVSKSHSFEPPAACLATPARISLAGNDRAQPLTAAPCAKDRRTSPHAPPAQSRRVGPPWVLPGAAVVSSLTVLRVTGAHSPRDRAQKAGGACPGAAQARAPRRDRPPRRAAPPRAAALAELAPFLHEPNKPLSFCLNFLVVISFDFYSGRPQRRRTLVTSKILPGFSLGS